MGRRFSEGELWVRVYLDRLRDQTLTPAAKLVAGWLEFELRGGKQKEITLTQIADATGLSKTAAERAVNMLTKKGLVLRKPSKRPGNRRVFSIPSTGSRNPAAGKPESRARGESSQVRGESSQVRETQTPPQDQKIEDPQSDRARGLRASGATLPRTPIAVLGDSTDADFERLKEALQYGTGGRPPPRPRDLNRLRAAPKGARELLTTGVDVDTLVDIAYGLAEMLDAGDGDRDHWRGPKFFSGWFDRIQNEVLEWRRKQERRAAELVPTVEPPRLDPTAIAEELEGRPWMNMVTRDG